MSINLLLLGIATTISPLFVLTAVVMMSTAMRVRGAWAAVAGWMVSIWVSNANGAVAATLDSSSSSEMGGAQF